MRSLAKTMKSDQKKRALRVLCFWFLHWETHTDKSSNAGLGWFSQKLSVQKKTAEQLLLQKLKRSQVAKGNCKINNCARANEKLLPCEGDSKLAWKLFSPHVSHCPENVDCSVKSQLWKYLHAEIVFCPLLLSIKPDHSLFLAICPWWMKTATFTGIPQTTEHLMGATPLDSTLWNPQYNYKIMSETKTFIYSKNIFRQVKKHFLQNPNNFWELGKGKRNLWICDSVIAWIYLKTETPSPTFPPLRSQPEEGVPEFQGLLQLAHGSTVVNELNR